MTLTATEGVFPRTARFVRIVLAAKCWKARRWPRGLLRAIVRLDVSQNFEDAMVQPGAYRSDACWSMTKQALISHRTSKIAMYTPDPVSGATVKGQMLSVSGNLTFTGFLYRSQSNRIFFVTALHRLTENEYYFCKHRGEENSWSGRFGNVLNVPALNVAVPLYNGDRPVFRWYHDPFNACIDVAAVEIQAPKNVAAINDCGVFGDYTIVETGLSVTTGSSGLMYSFPGGYSFPDGQAVAYKCSLAADFRANQFNFFVHSAGRAGSSGGPVVLRRERQSGIEMQTIGMYVADLGANGGFEQSSIERCMPLHFVREVVDGVPALDAHGNLIPYAPRLVVKDSTNLEPFDTLRSATTTIGSLPGPASSAEAPTS